MKREKTKALLVFIGLALLVAVDLYSEDKFKVIQQNNNAILSEYYYPLPLSATNNIDVQNNTMQIINRFSNKALEKHKETLLTRVDSTVSSTIETKGLNGLSSFKQTGKIESSLQIFNVKVQNEGLVEEMTKNGRVYYIKQLAIFSVGRAPINDSLRAYDNNGNKLERPSSPYIKKIKTYEEYQAESKRGTKLENHQTEELDFIITELDEKTIFYRDVYYNDIQLIKNNVDISIEAKQSKGWGSLPVAISQKVTIKVPKDLQKSVLKNYDALCASGLPIKSLNFQNIHGFENKLNDAYTKTSYEQNYTINRDKIYYETVLKKWNFTTPNLYLSVYIGDYHAGYILLYSGYKVLDEVVFDIQYSTDNISKANYKIRYEFVY